MPTYEFLCTDCGVSVDVRAAIEDRDAVAPACTTCGATQLRRALSTVGVVRSGGSPAPRAPGAGGGGCCGGGCCG